MSKTQKSFPVTFYVEHLFQEELRRLPWQHPIEEWKTLGVKHLDIKRGVGRHPLVFVEVGRKRFVIKELSFETSQREIENYKQMLLMGIHTLVPVGCVLREENPIAVVTPIGTLYERNLVGHTVTMLMDRVIPDSLLYRRAFKFENRQVIWDAIVDLFVDLHTNNVYWGDASLANTLVKFLKIDIPYIGKKTQLKAYLADAETVKIHRSLNDALRFSDVEFFLESMAWLNEDLRASGIVRSDLATQRDKDYVQSQYERMYEIALMERRFEEASNLNIKKYLGKVRDGAYLDLLQKHIEEHKWYLSERRQQEVDLKEAGQDWLKTIFVPLCELFKNENVLDMFPGKTASDLYVEIMTNKYYLSEKRGKDVGMVYAMHDYAERFGSEPPLKTFWRDIGKKMLNVLGMKEHWLLMVME